MLILYLNIKLWSAAPLSLDTASEIERNAGPFLHSYEHIFFFSCHGDFLSLTLTEAVSRGSCLSITGMNSANSLAN